MQTAVSERVTSASGVRLDVARALPILVDVGRRDGRS
jgi:hypothetical protein